jgi:type IV fimbrial biogenesis protein FimT
MNYKGSARGFSMVELLTVGAIILLVAAVATPTIMRSIMTYRIGGAATDVYNMVQRARYEAIRTNTLVTCRAEQAEGTWAVWVDLNNDTRRDADEPFVLMPASAQLLDAGDAPNAGSMGFPRTTAALPGAGVTFDFRGQVNFGGNPPSVLTIFIGAPNQPTLGFRALSVTPAGKVKTWRAAGEGYWSD